MLSATGEDLTIIVLQIYNQKLNQAFKNFLAVYVHLDCINCY